MTQIYDVQQTYLMYKGTDRLKVIWWKKKM